MKAVIWTDRKGYIRRSLIRDEDPDSMAKNGIPAGPPDLDEIDWEGMKREINNILVTEGLNTWTDVGRHPQGFQLAFSVLKRHLVDLYRSKLGGP